MTAAASERDEDSPGTLDDAQWQGMRAGFSEAGIIMPARQAQFVHEALSYRGMSWQHGPDLWWLSRREAGIVLEALHDRRRGVPHA